jgi:hypothetical protein
LFLLVLAEHHAVVGDRRSKQRGRQCR